MILLLALTGCNSTSEFEVATIRGAFSELPGDGQFEFEPSELTVTQDSEITITFDNRDRFRHDFVVVRGVFESEDEMREAMDTEQALIVGALGEVEPETAESLELSLDEPGTYQFFCSIPGHFLAGMRGTITVEG